MKRLTHKATGQGIWTEGTPGRILETRGEMVVVRVMNHATSIEPADCWTDGRGDADATPITLDDTDGPIARGW